MPLRGESVGTAYVRILADGSGLDDSIKDELNATEPVLKAQGARGSQAYVDGFKKHMKKEPTRKQMRDAIGNAVAGGDVFEKFLKSNKWKETVKALEMQFGEAGERAAANLANGLIEGGDFDAFKARLRNLQGEVSKAVEELQQVADEEDRRRLRKLGDEFDLLTDKVNHYTHGIGANRENRKQFLRELRDIRDGMRDAGGETEKFNLHADDVYRTLRRSNPTLDRFSGSMRRIGDRVGRVFGKGSRNDFLNFFGVFVGGLASLPGLLTKAVSGFINFGRKVADSFLEAGGGVSGFVSALGTLAAPLALLGAGLLVLVAILGPVAALISTLTGAVVALAGSLAFTLAGALGVVFGLLGPLIAGLAVFTAAVLSKKGAFKEVLRPLIDEFKELGEVAGGPILDGVKDAVAGLGPVISGLKPLISGISEAIGETIRGFGDALKGKGFKDFINVMERRLPDMVEKLGTIFGNVLGGLGGLFRAVIPITNEFLDWLVKITGEFADWINTKDGQQTMKEFFRKASESAKALWGFIKEAGLALGTLLDQGRPTGDDIFTSLKGKAIELRDFIQEQIDSGAMKQWFIDSKDTVDRLGESIEKIILIIEDLDTEETRDELDTLIESFNGLLEIMNLVATAGTAIFDAIDSFTQISSLAKIEEGMADLGEAAKVVKDAYKDTTKDLNRQWDSVRSKVEGVAKDVGKAFNTPLATIKDAWDRNVGRIRTILDGLKEKMREIGIFIGEKWDDIVKDVKSVPERIANLVEVFKTAGAALAKGLIQGLVDTDFGGAVSSMANTVWNAILARLNEAISRMNAAIPNSIGPIDLPDNPISPLARGTITSGPMLALIGESGREAVVPLDRPLSQVDPAVRELAAFARGLPTNGTARGGKTVDASGWTIVTPGTDSRAVANEVLNRLVATAYM